MRRPWIPEFDISTHRVLYAPQIQCGFCDQRTVQVIATVGLCQDHLEIVRAIELEGPVRAPRMERRRKPERKINTGTCRCGAVFSYTRGQAGTVRWCPDCRKRHGTYNRMQHVKRLERERRRSA